MKQYFYITTHFLPKYDGVVFTLYGNNIYEKIETGEKFRKRLLYDFGWGQEYGFELLPQLPFDSLIKLIEYPKEYLQKKFYKTYSRKELQEINIECSNLYGSISVIMQDYVPELIEFLSDKIKSDYFSDLQIRQNFKNFSFSSEKTRAEGKIPGGVLDRSYEEILCDYPKWNRIAAEVIDQIYI